VLIWCCQGSCTPINLRLLSLYNPLPYLTSVTNPVRKDRDVPL
jgi:hypothetical protein